MNTSPYMALLHEPPCHELRVAAQTSDLWEWLSDTRRVCHQLEIDVQCVNAMAYLSSAQVNARAKMNRISRHDLTWELLVIGCAAIVIGNGISHLIDGGSIRYFNQHPYVAAQCVNGEVVAKFRDDELIFTGPYRNASDFYYKSPMYLHTKGETSDSLLLDVLRTELNVFDELWHKLGLRGIKTILR